MDFALPAGITLPALPGFTAEQMAAFTAGALLLFVWWKWKNIADYIGLIALLGGVAFLLKAFGFLKW